LARKLEGLEPSMCKPYALEARGLAARGETGAAIDRLERNLDKVTDRVSCLRGLVALAVASHDERRLDAALSEIARAGCADAKQCVGNLVWVAQAQESRGSPRAALAVYKRAAERAPDDDAILENVARLAGATGLHAEALKDYQELARRHPGERRWTTEAEGQRGAMFGGVGRF
jgi:tetratricopeptide (TPR) repeat protein